ncbi:glucose-1-phosphate adenylyltransferase family protein [Sutcliffiella rhizosphaerae]|uniref:Uncharacterized protein n=1 Tax=Sutcliffiella rhizosphaerae TaxID=2880967 RepID=A0ABM8YM20_9BACI|nr:hypothetical protein [Sutcliffiella rhizosphaerae]CAG9621006.1 hypothetical protein BACCIP111883_01778 [Sutcliffiella rhizosphaerae]
MYYYEYPHYYHFHRNGYMPAYYPSYPIVYYQRPYPPVDATFFSESASAMQSLMKEASIILQKLSDSKVFASEVMSAAQEGNKKKVDQLIKSTGVHAGIHVDFTPDGIRLTMSSQAEGTQCCHLTIELRWNVL